MRQSSPRDDVCMCMVLMSIWCAYYVNMCKRARWHAGGRGVYGSMYKCVS